MRTAMKSLSKIYCTANSNHAYGDYAPLKCILNRRLVVHHRLALRCSSMQSKFFHGQQRMYEGK